MSRTYSVDEASSLLGIPRPTLYRYLREYSIPNLRKSGRISIPEDSVEKIRRVRDLHREGMGTGSVRRIMKDPPQKTDEVEITSRLDRITQELEGAKVEVRQPETLSSDQAIRTILARQTMLISAVINLTGMVEDMMRLNGHPPRKQSTGLATDVLGFSARVNSTSREVAMTGGHRSSSRSARSGASARSSATGGSPTVRVAGRRRRTTAVESGSSFRSSGRTGRNRKGGDRTPTFRSGYGTLARKRRRFAWVLLVTIAVAVIAAVALSLFGSL